MRYQDRRSSSRSIKLVAAALASLFIGLPESSAGTLVSTLPSYDGPTNTSGFAIDLGIVGTFSYSLPSGASITAATFSGTYGTAFVPSSTSGFDVVIAGQTINACLPYAADCWVTGANFRPFSFDLNPSTFGALATGSVGLRVIQINEFNVRLGSPTLTIDYAEAVPEPASMALAATGIACLCAAARRRRNS